MSGKPATAGAFEGGLQICSPKDSDCQSKSAYSVNTYFGKSNKLIKRFKELVVIWL
jgi:hypothetical protein